MTLDDFAGDWCIDRRIEDRRLARCGSLRGRATFTPDKAGLLYIEDGQLRFPGQPVLTARQSYLWRAAGDGIAVHFSDCRPFHRFLLTPAPYETDHHCPPDDYKVRYDFTDWPNWRAVWRVAGPRKDYTVTTDYSRCAA